jgi:predicted Zn-dependent protease
MDGGLKPELEYEADQSAVEYTWATGYDPRHFRSFMERLAKNHQEDTTKKLLKTHPSFDDRLKKIDSQLKELGFAPSAPVVLSARMNSRFSVLTSKQ